MSTTLQRVVVFILAAISSLILSSVYYGYSLGSDQYVWLIVAGVEALIIYEIMYRTQVWVRLLTLPIYGVLFLLIRSFVGSIVVGVWYNEPSAFQSLSQFETYSYGFTDSFSLITVGIIVIVAYFFISGRSFSLPAIGKIGGQSNASEKIMLEISGDLVTRLLCTSAVTQGILFRKKVLDRVKQRYTAVAPEFGLDLELVAGVCHFIERRETKFQIAFFVAGLIGIVLSGTPIGLLAMVVITAPIMFIKLYNEKFDLLKSFTSHDYNKEKVMKRFALEQKYLLLERLKEGFPKPNQNLVVYGGFSPFVGAGYDLGGWSFALDISRPKNQLGLTEAVSEFDINKIYKEIETACTSLNLPNLRIVDLSFVNGLDIRNDKTILPNAIGKPVQHLDTAYLTSADDYKVRRYKHISVSAWGNDIVFSIFMRCTIKGNNLFVEVARYLLPPVNNQYRKLNQSTEKNWSNIAGIVLRALVLGPINGYFAWLILFAKFLGFISSALGLQDRKSRNDIKKNPDYNYGVQSSLREEVSGAFYQHYFQKLDREMYVKILDSEILETIIRFLDEHNVDTSQLRERQTTILNNGLFVGGNLESDSIAIGQKAKATTNNQNKAFSRKE